MTEPLTPVGRVYPQLLKLAARAPGPPHRPADHTSPAKPHKARQGTHLMERCSQLVRVIEAGVDELPFFVRYLVVRGDRHLRQDRAARAHGGSSLFYHRRAAT